jgi:microcystin-dependent protein
MFTYSTRIENFVTIGTLTPVGGSNCPKGRFLFENGRKLYPGTHPGIQTYMVGVYDPVSFLNGIIDPNSKLFSPMNTDKSYAAQITDAARGVFGTNPNGGVESDQGPGIMTLANCQFGANVDISGNLVTNGDSGVVGNLDISGNLVVHGTATFEDVTVNNLTIHGNATQIDITDMNSEQFSITNNGTGPALIVNQLGAQDIVHFKDDGATALIVKDGGNVGVGTATPGYKLEVNGALNANPIYQNGSVLVPPGSLMMYIAAAAPGGWLVCNGSAVSRSTYAALFAVIGTTYGVGDNATTFNLPDMRGRVPVGSGTGAGLTTRSLGGSGGAETHTLSTSEIPSHSHTGTTDSSGSHTHTHNANNEYPGATLAFRNGVNTRIDADAGQPNEINLDASVALVIDSAGTHTHTFTTGTTGGGGAHNNMQPYMVVNYIIKY